MRGFAAPEVGHAFTRARDLCRQVEDTSQLCNILLSLHAFYQAQGDHQTSRELVEQSLALAQRLHEPGRIMRGHRNLGTVLYWPGEIVPASLHLEQALTLLGPYPTLIPGQDSRVLPLWYKAPLSSPGAGSTRITAPVALSILSCPRRFSPVPNAYSAEAGFSAIFRT
jgi:hypothetical protein